MKKKYRFENFLFTDSEIIEKHLAKMAAKGWQLEKIGPFCWTYRRAEPQKLTYSVVYFSEASEFNPGPTDNQQTFHEYCQAAGWRFVAELAQMQVFSSSRPNPVPIESDEGLKLRSIHSSMKKNFLPSTILMILLGFLQLFSQWSSFRSGPVRYLSGGTGLCAAGIWLVLCLYLLYSLADYWIWYRRSQKSVSAGGACISKNPLPRKIIGGAVLLWTTLIVLLFLFILLGNNGWWAGVAGMAITAAAMFVVLAVRKGLKKAKVSRKINLAVTIVASFAVTFALLGLMTWVIVSTDLTRHQPSEIYTVTGSNGTTWDWRVYRDPIPLRLEDLGLGLGYGHYSYELEEESTFLLSRLSARQNALPDGQDAPELTYEVAAPAFPWLYDLCLRDYLEDAYIPEHREFVPVEEPAWGARQVYHLMQDGEDFRGTYLVCYDSRIVRLTVYGAGLSDEQIRTAARKLLPQEGV